jgi:hypothetical protein
MPALVARCLLGLVAWVGLVLSPALVTPTVAAASGCPARPWTLASIASVPSLWGETSWPPAAVRRAACFGDARISFVAQGGMLLGAFPGVRITPAFGRMVWLISGRQPDSEGWDLNAWIPPGLEMSAQDAHAYEMTSPGLSREGWQDVWWRGSGHFNDPAAAGCSPDDGTSTVDGVPIILTPAEAVEFCRNEFVLDSLTRVPVPPTDAAPGPEPATPAPSAPMVGGALVCLVFAIMLVVPVRVPRRADGSGAAG